MQQPLVLMVLDGWGQRADGPDNAIARAPAVHFSRLWEAYPHTTLEAGGEAVGLLPGQMGDSNVGHLTLGAGRVIYQDLARIHRAVADGSLGQMPLLKEFLAGVRPGRLHLLGLLSPGGVHSHQEHLAALLHAAREAGLAGDEVVVHVWTDGRDVPPGSAPASLAFLEGVIAEAGVGRIATVSGRYYAMDRDRRWERTERAYRAMVEGQGPEAPDPDAALQAAYAAGQTDEFVPPTVIGGEGGPGPFIREEDSVFVYNFRADRVRQIVRALADPEFDAFVRPFPRVRRFLGMTQYDRGFMLPYLFGPQAVPDNFAEWLSRLGHTQLHVAETEKYAHVTYFFNGGVETPYPGEDRRLIPSPKVATYDLTPAMSAPAIADAVLEGLESGRYAFILLNFANPDMVGHTGNLQAAEEAVRVVDAQIGRIAAAVERRGGILALVADHGNAEVMVDPDGHPNTQHTTNPVPFVLVSDRLKGRSLLEGGGLADVAPTLLAAAGVPIPEAMTGRVLLV